MQKEIAYFLISENNKLFEIKEKNQQKANEKPSATYLFRIMVLKPSSNKINIPSPSKIYIFHLLN